MVEKTNAVLNFSLFNHFGGPLTDFNELLEGEMMEVQKKVREIKNKERQQTLEEEHFRLKRQFKRSQNLYESYDPAKFETKARVDLLFFEHLFQNLPNIKYMEEMVGNLYRTVKTLYEVVNMKPENYKGLSSNILVESVDNQKKAFSKIISEHINNKYYKYDSKTRQEKYLEESQEYATYLIEKGMESEEAIKLSVKACLMESLLKNIAMPNFVQKRIKYLCEDADYGKVFDQEYLKNLWTSFNTQIKDMSKIFAAAI